MYLLSVSERCLHGPNLRWMTRCRSGASPTTMCDPIESCAASRRTWRQATSQNSIPYLRHGWCFLKRVCIFGCGVHSQKRKSVGGSPDFVLTKSEDFHKTIRDGNEGKDFGIVFTCRGDLETVARMHVMFLRSTEA